MIPCFNHGSFVAEAVRSCLAQIDAEVRVIVVNDGSEDGVTARACAACVAMDADGGRVSVIHQRNRGLPAARNAGARAARDSGWGQYLVFLDADDWIEPAFVSTLHSALEHAGDASASHAYCQEQLVDKGSGVWRVPEWDPLLLMVTNLHPVTALVRVDRFQEVGGFDETMTSGYEDWDLWLRFAEHGWRGVRVREPLFVWRRHSESTMVMQAVQKHAELFSMIVARHAALYAKRWREVIEKSNTLLRSADANWLDESGEAICIRDMRSWAREVEKERDAAIKLVDATKVELTAEREAREALERAVSELEHKPSVRLSRRLFEIIDGLPNPLAEPFRAMVRWARRSL